MQRGYSHRTGLRTGLVSKRRWIRPDIGQGTEKVPWRQIHQSYFLMNEVQGSTSIFTGVGRLTGSPAGYRAVLVITVVPYPIMVRREEAKVI